MATHSSTLAWKIPWMEEPGGLQSTGSLGVGHHLSNFTLTFHFHASEKEMATHSSVLAWRIPGTGDLVGCCLWGCTESDTTEATWKWSLSSVWSTGLTQDKGTSYFHCGEFFLFIENVNEAYQETELILWDIQIRPCVNYKKTISSSSFNNLHV